MHDKTPIKFVLSGGFPDRALDGGKAFIEAITEGLSTPSILLCTFARPKEEWKMKYDEIETLFSRWSKTHLTMTLANESSFLQEIENHQIIYFTGGDTPTLFEKLTGYNNDANFWCEHFTGKVVAGSSAGVNVLTNLSYNVDHNRLQSGLGLINMASLVHYCSDTYNNNLNWDLIDSVLNKNTFLPILRIKEGEFVVIEQ